MQRKEPADWVFFNVTLQSNDAEAIAIYNGTIIDIGSIPYIFSNYRGFKDFNAQGNFIYQTNANQTISIGESANGLVVATTQEFKHESVIWKIVNNDCKEINSGLLDAHWDDH